MSFLDRVEACNRFDIANFIAFSTDGHIVGWLRPSIAELLASAPSIFIKAEDGLYTDDPKRNRDATHVERRRT